MVRRGRPESRLQKFRKSVEGRRVRGRYERSTPSPRLSHRGRGVPFCAPGPSCAILPRSTSAWTEKQNKCLRSTSAWATKQDKFPPFHIGLGGKAEQMPSFPRSRPHPSPVKNKSRARLMPYFSFEPESVRAPDCVTPAALSSRRPASYRR